MARKRAEHGFTLVELMTVCLIVGILVTIAIPIYQGAAQNARSRACQANQRTIAGVVAMYLTDPVSGSTSTAGTLQAGGSGWYGILVPSWLEVAPLCPSGETPYLLETDGRILGDQGAVPGFRLIHTAP